MKKTLLFNAFTLLRQSLQLVWACIILAPLASFGQQYQQTNLVSTAGGPGIRFADPNLADPWGIARSTAGPWWVSDRARGVSTLYAGDGTIQPLVVRIPHAAQSPLGNPTGLVSNGSSDFEVEPGKPALFIFASFDGTISAWNPQANPTVAIEKVSAKPGSLLTAATVAQVKESRFLYVADLQEGKIRVFDPNFHPVETSPYAFRDERLPENFAPFNVQNIGGDLYVAFAQQNPANNFVGFGANLGAVDVFSPEGFLLKRFERGPWFNAPWGLALAPTDFGSFSHRLLVGQFGGGEILAFDTVTGRFAGKVRNQDGQVFRIPGLWGIAFGAGNTKSGAANELYFNAGVNEGTAGLFGKLAPVPSELTQGNDQ